MEKQESWRNLCVVMKIMCTVCAITEKVDQVMIGKNNSSFLHLSHFKGTKFISGSADRFVIVWDSVLLTGILKYS